MTDLPRQQKGLDASKGNVGQQLKARRIALKLSLAQVEIDTKIRGKFLIALEAGEYEKLPNDIYSRGFVQHYGNHLGLDGAMVAATYAVERGGVMAGDTRRPKLERSKRFVLTGPLIAAAGGLAMIAAVFGYLLWQFSGIAGAPQLSVTSPATDLAITGGTIEVDGHTIPGADVSVNGSPVLTDTNGNFSEKVALQNGVNPIHVTSVSKLGKTTIVTRNVLATLPAVDAAEAVVPSAVFSGIAVALSVNETTSIEVTVDGKVQFQGTFVKGKSQTFTGIGDVNITTGNAGATSLAVTNSVVANAKLSPLGSEGEIRRNQDFTNTTVIP